MSTLQRIEEPGDAELISAVRGGDVSAYGDLFERHVVAARRLARQLVSHGDVDDLVSDAFAKVLGVLQRGGGPDVAFRAYLLTAVRRLHVDKIRSTSRLTTTDDMEAFDPGLPFRDTAVEGFENAAAAKAFASLPERWQLVLWHTEVEGAKPAEVAELLGMSPNSVSALAYRAREGLRQAFLNMHAKELDEDDCRWTNQHVGAYIRNGVSKRDAGKVEAHLDDCRKCMAIYLELSEVNSNLSAILAPLLLGSAGAAYLAGVSGVAAKAGLLGVLGRTRDAVVGRGRDVLGGNAGGAAGSAAGGAAVAGNVGAIAVVGGAVVVSAVVGGVLAVTGVIGGNDGAPTAGERPLSSASDGSDPGGDGTSSETPTDGATDAPTDAPTDEATDGATDAPTDGATDGATDGPTDGTTDNPTENPTESPTENPTGNPTGNPTTGPTPGEDILPDSDGGPVTFDLLANDSNAAGDELRLLSVSGAEHGTVVRGAAGARAASRGIVTYSPDRKYKGPDSFTYVVGNGAGDQSEGRVRIMVRNGKPVAVADEQNTTRNSSGVGVDVLRNDTDPNGDDLRIEDFTASTEQSGTVTRAGDGLEYTPKPGFRGVDTFTYLATDGDRSDRGTVTFGVSNRAPVADADAASTDTNTAIRIDVLRNDTDEDGDVLAPEIAAQPENGSASVNGDGTITYTPNDGFKGEDPFTYTVTDGDRSSGVATVSITVRNGSPDAVDDPRVATPYWTPVDIDVLNNDTDPNDDDLTITDVTRPTSPGVRDAGTVQIIDNRVTYTPPRGLSGVVTFDYTISDGDGGSDTATVTVNVANAPPEAGDDSGDSAGGRILVSVLENDTDPNGDALSIASFDSRSANGGLVTQEGSRLAYTPASGFHGTDTVAYEVTDGQGGTDAGLVTVTVTNSAPVAVSDDFEVTAKADGTSTLDVLANDTDLNGDALRIVEVGAATGTVRIVDNRIVHTYQRDFAGLDTFTYVVVDDRGGRAKGSVAVTVLNTKPNAVADFAVTNTGKAVTINALLNDTDDNGDAISLVSVADPANGRARIEDGKVVYTPDTGFQGGTDAFDYTVRDARGATSTGTISVQVRSDLIVIGRTEVVDGERRVFADVSGIDPAGSATLTVRLTGFGLTLGVPDGCLRSQGRFVCQVSADSTVGPFSFTDFPGWRATLTVIPVGFTDADPSNNTDVIP